jgi:hypothetical protein
VQVVKPEEVAIGAARVTIRNPVAVWILSFFILGIYMVVWWYQVNRELRDYSQAVGRPFRASPALAAVLVALWPVAFLPGMVTVFVTARRVRKVEEWVDAPGRIVPVLAVLLFPLLFASSWYVQRALNETWRRAKQGAGPPPVAGSR